MASYRRVPRSRSMDPNMTFPTSYRDSIHHADHGRRVVSPASNDPYDLSAMSLSTPSPTRTTRGVIHLQDVSMLSPVSDRSGVEPMSVSDISDQDLVEDNIPNPIGSGFGRVNYNAAQRDGTQWLWSLGDTGTESVADDAVSCVSSISGMTKSVADDAVSCVSSISGMTCTRRAARADAQSAIIRQGEDESDSDESVTHSVRSVKVARPGVGTEKTKCCTCRRLTDCLLLLLLLTLATMFMGSNINDIMCKQSLALNVTQLHSDLQTHVFGQHIAIETVTKSLTDLMASDTINITVLSFNGWTGIGKNYISSFVTRHVNEEHVHKVIIPMEFAHSKDDNIHREAMFKRLTGSVAPCRVNLFIIDEVDKSTKEAILGLRDGLRNLSQSALDRTKVIVLLLTNSGGSAINRYFLDQLRAGRPRESVEREEVVAFMLRVDEAQVSHEWYIPLFKDNIISAIVPFLPLEKSHVSECAKHYLSESRPLLGPADSEDITERVLEQMAFFPAGLELFSTTGCRGVVFKVDLTVD